jgi:peroxiredoxin Q/BCP
MAKKTVAKSSTSRSAGPAAGSSAKKQKKSSTKSAAPAPAPVSPADGPAEGAAAPAFNLPRDGGGAVALKDFKGRKLVLFFYPRADTPGCTREAMDFTRLAKEFDAAGAAVLGVSADPVKAQDAFRTKHSLGVPLASDEAHAMISAYGAWGQKSMYGRTFEGVLRTTVLIGPTGRIARVWRNVKVEGHADEVLEAARAL